MTRQQELDLSIKKAQYNKRILDEMFPDMFHLHWDADYGDDRQQAEAEEERFSQEGN